MDLTQLEKWQLLAWLLHHKTQHSISEKKCLALHHLLMALVGEHYQQLMCEPPNEPPRNIVLRLSPGQLEICDVATGNVLYRIDNADVPPVIPAQILLQNHINECVASSPDDTSKLYDTYIESLAGSQAIAPQPLDEESWRGDRSGKLGRKWKKFRRDPVLFFKDFLGKARR